MSDYNISSEKFEITPEKISKFESIVKDFYCKLAKGQGRIIRYYNEKDQIIIVVMHGSYKRSIVIWDDQQIKTLFFRPANEDILRFDKKTSKLSIKTPYQKERDNYIEAFTKTIVEDETQSNRPDRDSTYTLKPLQDGAFSFAGNEEISSITLLEIKLAIRGSTNPAITIKSSDVMKTLEDDLDGISLDLGDLVHAKFRFRIKSEGKWRNITFEITPPNVTDLTKKKHADIISNYLMQNGVKLA